MATKKEGSATAVLGGGYLAAIICGVLMPVLDATLVSIGMDTLVEAFGSTTATMQWVSTAYLLALAATVPLSGWLLELLGGRRAWMGNLIGFVVASVGCAASTTPLALIAFRAIQGAFAGVLMTLTQTLPVREARRLGVQRTSGIVATITLPLSLGPVLGPPVGGIILSALSWHWLFLVNVPLGLVAIVLTARYLPRDDGSPSGREVAGRLDVIGVTEVVVGLVLALLGLTNIAHAGANVMVGIVLPLVAGFALLALFCRHCLRYDGEPLVDVRLLRWPATRAASAAAFFFGICLYAAQFILPLWWQQMRGVPVGETGMLLMAQGIGVLVSRMFVGRITAALGDRTVATSAFVPLAVSTLPFCLMPDASVAFLTAVLFVRGLAQGTVNIPINSAGYVGLPEQEVSHATMIVRVAQQIGSSFGTAMIAVTLEAVSTATGAATGTDNAQGFAAVIIVLSAAALVGALLSLALPKTEDAA